MLKNLSLSDKIKKEVAKRMSKDQKDPYVTFKMAEWSNNDQQICLYLNIILYLVENKLNVDVLALTF